MEYIAIGFLAGALFAAIMILVMTGGKHDMNKAERNGNSNSIDTDNVADRGMDRDNIDVEAVINTLNALRMVTTGSETAKLDYAAECVEKVDRLNKWIKEVQHVAI